MINTIFFALIVSLMTWFALDQSYYSPKAQIKRLWKRVHKFSEFISHLEGPNMPSYIADSSKAKRRDIGRLINSLLDYYFDKDIEEDRNYIKENRYTDDYIKHEEFVVKKVQELWIQEEDWGKIEKFLNKK